MHRLRTADAAKQVRLGEALATSHGDGQASGSDAEGDTEGDVGADAGAEPDPGLPWHAPLSDALLGGAITSAQHDAIIRGLGDPVPGDRESVAEAAEAWSLAAVELIAEARERTVEELARTARTVRDHPDPEGAQRRFDERFEGRSFRMWTDADGRKRGSVSFDDEAYLWIQSAIDAAMRPRRGGPRFVDPAEKAAAEDLTADPRTNDQLTYDLLIDIFRAGILADATTVFGTKQAGVRVVITEQARAESLAGRPAVGVTEDELTALPAWLIAQHACDTGTTELRIDRDGNPLYLGREARLFTPKQKIALAIRDGGCRWKGCDRPASYCEAHHIDHHSEGGKTDVDRGVLLCRFHHMALHNGGWRITRDGPGDFLLHPPHGTGNPIILKPRLALRYAWAGIHPPPKRFRPAA
ncbi:DUF222 domain-containing protein [Microbacterium sp.]|uniref:HNH endonuclease signature motif containing protein n=1 Tax=Microbacterium sp. TaxID=51671 RepID=UPI0039E6F7BC